MTPPLPPTPFTVICDTAEQLPFAFGQPLRTPGSKKPQTIQTASKALFLAPGTLLKGDYSLEGFEQPSLDKPSVMIERKSLADAFGTFGNGRERFERKLPLLNAFTVAFVIIEAEWSTVWMAPPEHSRLSPKSIMCSIIAWQCRFPRVQWAFLPGRDVAEAYTVLVLERFWRDMQHATATAATLNKEIPA